VPRRAFIAAFVLCAPLAFPSETASAQATPPVASAGPPADPKDVSSPDAIIAALYDVISGPAGQVRNWDRFKSLFVAGARLIPTGVGPDKAGRIRMMTPDEYSTQAARGLQVNGFFEREIGRSMDSFGTIAHAFSAYESKRTQADPQPFARGINSIQLFNDGKRWYVVTVFWDSERPDNPIPAKYLTKK
jgi:hypothetical protein